MPNQLISVSRASSYVENEHVCSLCNQKTLEFISAHYSLYSSHSLSLVALESQGMALEWF